MKPLTISLLAALIFNAAVLPAAEKNITSRYAYLKSGDLGPMRQILCKLCACGKPEEDLLAQLRAADPVKKILLAGEWNNRAIHCEKRPTYPMEAWAQFLNENGITERRRYQRID
jgi:hypothetical protein